MSEPMTMTEARSHLSAAGIQGVLACGQTQTVKPGTAEPGIRKLKGDAVAEARRRGHRMGRFARRDHPAVVNYIAVCLDCHRIAIVCRQGYCGDATRTDCPHGGEQ